MSVVSFSGGYQGCIFVELKVKNAGRTVRWRGFWSFDPTFGDHLEEDEEI